MSEMPLTSSIWQPTLSLASVYRMHVWMVHFTGFATTLNLEKSADWSKLFLYIWVILSFVPCDEKGSNICG